MKGDKPQKTEDGAGGTFQPQVVTLCGVQGCCPTVTIEKNKVVITDDNGGEVNLTREEFGELLNIKPA